MKNTSFKWPLITAAALLAGGCANLFPTPYAQGLRLTETEAFFEGNASTPPERAPAFTEIAVIERCMDKGWYPLVHHGADESSTSRRVVIENYGGENYYPVTYSSTAPAHRRLFGCFERLPNLFFVKTGIAIGESLHPFTGDFLPGLYVQENKFEPHLVKHDVIVRINGSRVIDKSDLTGLLSSALRRGKTSAKLTVVRQHKVVNVQVPLADYGPYIFTTNHLIRLATLCGQFGNEDKTLDRVCRRPKDFWVGILLKNGITDKSVATEIVEQLNLPLPPAGRPRANRS